MKRVASTSRLAFKKLLDVLQPRERDVLLALRAEIAEHGQSPTAYELLKLDPRDKPLRSAFGIVRDSATHKAAEEASLNRLFVPRREGRCS